MTCHHFTGTITHRHTFHHTETGRHHVVHLTTDDGHHIVWETTRRVAAALRRGHRYRITARRATVGILEGRAIVSVARVSRIRWLASRRHAPITERIIT